MTKTMQSEIRAAPARGRGDEGLARRRPYLTCRLCWRIAIFVFLSIVAVEAVILVPSYLRQERSLLEHLEANAQAVLSASLHAQLEGGQGIPIFAFGDMAVMRPLAGLRLYSEAGNMLGSYGEMPRADLKGLADATDPRLRRNQEGRYLVVWTPEDLRAPVTAIANIDSSGVAAELMDFVHRILLLTLVISLFASIATLAVLSVIVLRPILLLHRQMMRAQQDPETADQHTLDYRARDELGDMIAAFNALVHQLAGRYRSELDASKQRFQDFANSASDWYWEMDENLRFTYFSERYTAVSGVQPEVLLGKTREETGIPDVDPEMWRKQLADLAAHRPFRGFVHPRRWPDGETVWLSINGQPHYDENGRFLGYRGTGSDITQLKRTEEELRLSRDRAEVANRAKSEFLANMSHEIRTPMTAVIGMAELLRSSPLTAEQRDKVETIIRSGESLLVIINDVLDLSRLEAGKLEIDRSDIDLVDLLHGVLDLMAEKAREKQLALSLELPDGLSRYVHADGSRIRQLLINLVGNALKFTERGSVSIAVEQRPLGGPGQPEGALELRFSVTDSGIGVAPGDLDRLFEKFEQGNSATNRHYGGSGLGLAICKQIVELMDGEIGGESSPGVGSSFWFSLPLRKAEGVGSTGAPRLPEAVPTRASRALRILLAEDNAVNQTLISSLLGGFGHRLTLAGDGRRAVETALAQPFDVILMDVRMPLVDGLQATRQIRDTEGPNRAAPIIAVTADAMVSNEQGFLKAGMNAVATKPIRLAQLLGAIDRALGETIHVAEPPPDSAEEAASRPAEAPDGVSDGDRALLEQLESLRRNFG